MSKKPCTFISVWLLILVPSMAPTFAQSSREAEGKAAEQAGRLREALTHYVAALQSVSEGSADDQRLRETIIKLVQKLSPPPAVPEEARRYSVRGQIAIKEAKSPADFDEAAKEFGKALRVAPWWADGYVNHGVALEKAGKYTEAIHSLKFYLLAAPAAPDADKIKEQIYALEYRQERAGKEAIAKREEQERKRREDEAKASAPARLAGTWCEDSGCRIAWEVKVSGDMVEFLQCCDNDGRTYLRIFRGKVANERISGTSFINGPSGTCEAPLTTEATVSPDRNRIELVHVSSYNGWYHFGRCQPSSPPKGSPTWFTRRVVLVRR